MNEKAMFDLTYGLFLIGTKAEGKENACVVNTVIQAAGQPTRVTLCAINGNLTGQLIRKSGYFTVTILDETAEFPLFQNFGLQHGFDVNKFEGYEVHYDHNGMPYVLNNACALLSCKVVETHDLGSHTLFIAEVTDMDKFNTNRPVTYAEYHSRIKVQPKKEETRKPIAWKCNICGYVYEGETLPEDFVCPWCGHPASDFSPVYE